jgi:hypothetical protein
LRAHLEGSIRDPNSENTKKMSSSKESNGRKVVIGVDYRGLHFTKEILDYMDAKGGCPHAKPKFNYCLSRHCPLFVEAVENVYTGKSLKVVQIEEDDDRYYIFEYDGMEMLYTPSTIEWLSVSDFK